MALGELHLKNIHNPDYTALHCSGGGNCPHQKTAETKVGDDVYRSATTIPCIYHQNRGESAALWARRNDDGTCPHFVEAVL